MEERQSARLGRLIFDLSAMRRFLRTARLRLPVALAVVFAIPLAVLFYFQFRSVSDLAASSAVVLETLSKQTTDSAVNEIETALRAPRLAVIPFLPPDVTDPLNVSVIEDTFARALDALPLLHRLYVWSDVANLHRGELLAYDRGRRHLYGGLAEAADLIQSVHRSSSGKQVLNRLTLNIRGRRTYVDATIRYDEPKRDRIRSFVLIAFDAEYLRRDFIPNLLSSHAASWPRPFVEFPSLDVTLLDEEGLVIWPVSGSAATHFISEREVPLLFFHPDLARMASLDPLPEIWRLQAGYGGQSIAGIVAARERLQYGTMALLAAMMGLGVFLVVRAAGREIRVAELKSDFVLSVSHDLKTPLALIQLFAETLELGRAKTQARAQEYYSIINCEARKLTRLINNILDSSRIEAGLKHYRPEPLDLAAVASEVLASLGSQVRLNRFIVTAQFADNLRPVMVDHEAATQAIENLISNAMKYSLENREIAVEVGESNRYGWVCVSDRGIGIPARLHRKIFRKFFRVGSDAASGPQGCGLGLAIVAHVVQAHGGFVQVESETGRGSMFTLHFPVYDGALKDAETNSRDRRRASDVARSA